MVVHVEVVGGTWEYSDPSWIVTLKITIKIKDYIVL